MSSSKTAHGKSNFLTIIYNSFKKNSLKSLSENYPLATYCFSSIISVKIGKESCQQRDSLTSKVTDNKVVTLLNITLLLID